MGKAAIQYFQSQEPETGNIDQNDRVSLGDIRTRKFGENPKRAGTVSVRLGLNARWALNASSSLERSEKVGSKSQEQRLPIASQETYFDGSMTEVRGFLCTLSWEYRPRQSLRLPRLSLSWRDEMERHSSREGRHYMFFQNIL